MKKRIIIITSLIILSLVVLSLYNTFATEETSLNDNVYNITLTGNNDEINVPARSSKIIYYKVCNTNKGKVKYGVGYKSDNIIVKEYWDSTDPTTNIIDYGENKFIKLKLINDTEEDGSVEISTVLGYEEGGDLITRDNVTLVTKVVGENNVMMASNSETESTDNFLRSTIKREEIATITFVDNNIVPIGLTGVDVSLDEDGTVMMWYTNNNEDNKLYDVYIGAENGTVSLSSGYQLFKNLINVTKIDFKNNIDTSKVTEMISMFNRCRKITTLNLSNFDTSNTTDMKYMFYECNNILNLDLTNFDTSNVTSFEYMFYECRMLKNLNLTSFNTSNVTSLNYMFFNCNSLESLDLRSFNTSNVISMQSIFNRCKNIKVLDLSNFDTTNITNMRAMFYDCNSLTTIYVSNLWNTLNVQENIDMFYNCLSLVGGSGTKFNSNYIDKTYARIDGGTSIPGYLTLKTT